MAVIPLAGAPISFCDVSLSLFQEILLVQLGRMTPNAGMNRRKFLHATALATTAGAWLPLNTLAAAEKPKGGSWPIGCFNRPWLGTNNKWDYDTALDGINAAGYKLTGMLTRTAKEPFIGSDATPEYLAGLKKRITARGLAVNMGALRIKSDLPLADQIKDARQQIDNGKTVGVEFLLTFGANNAAQYDDYYKLMQDAAAYSQERGLKLVLKPHGGASGAAEEMMRCLEKVKHPNFKIWFDAGNVIYYTGKDPLEELKPLAHQVTGLCAKDCAEQKGSVWLQFGTGKVDFRALFTELKQAGFNGPVMVECCVLGDTPEVVTANTRKNKQYLENLFATL
jgi:sugar phosphate isomerase/epimerase